MRRKPWFLLITLGFASQSYGQQVVLDPANAPPAPPPTAGQTPGASPTPGPNEMVLGVSERQSLLTGFMDPFPYDPNEKRDPFAPPQPDKPLPAGSVHGPILPLQRFTLDKLKLMAVIWDVSRPKAMLKDPDGKTHIVGPNAKVGPKNGYVAVIREGEIVIVETEEREGRLYSTAQVVKIAK